MTPFEIVLWVWAAAVPVILYRAWTAERRQRRRVELTPYRYAHLVTVVLATNARDKAMAIRVAEESAARRGNRLV